MPLLLEERKNDVDVYIENAKSTSTTASESAHIVHMPRYGEMTPQAYVLEARINGTSCLRRVQESVPER